MERSVTVAKYSFCTSTSNYKMHNVNLQSFQIQKIQSLGWVIIYLRLEIALWSHLSKVPSENPCFGNYVVSFNTPYWFQSFNQNTCSFVTYVEASICSFLVSISALSSYHNRPKFVSRTQDQDQGCKLANVSWRRRYDPFKLDPLPCP